MILSHPTATTVSWYSSAVVAKGLALALLAVCLGSVYPLLLGDIHTHEVLATYFLAVMVVGLLAVSTLTVRGAEMKLEGRQRREAVRMIIYVTILSALTVGIIDAQIGLLRIQ